MIRLVLFAAMVLSLAAASAWSVRLACADYWFRKQTVQGTEKALLFTPGRSDYYVGLALLQPDEKSQIAKDALNRAVAIEGSNARAWIELGLRYENDGNQSLAEQSLLRAAEEDKQYLPRWTLMNYYYRTDGIDRFWLWAKDAARMTYGDPTPFFQLCGRVSEDGALIDRLQIKRPDVRAGYLSYLLSQRRLDLILPASKSLMNGTRTSDVPLLVSACDLLLESKNVVDALAIWNGLAGNHGIPFERLQPGKGTELTNGDFRVPLTLHGFNWRMATTDGVSVSADESGGIRINFSGSQPEDCEPLVQFVPVLANMDYHLKFEYRASGIPARSGLAWRVTDGEGTTLADANQLSAEDKSSGEVSFVTPNSCHLTRVALQYRRAPGTTRIEGFLILRRVELQHTLKTTIHESARTIS